MAQVYQLEVIGAQSQTDFDKYAHSLMFAESIQPVYVTTDISPNQNCVIVTSNVESEDIGATYIKLADDSQSETSVDISTGKFVEGNLIAVLCPLSEAQSDLRDFVTYFSSDGGNALHIGVCNTTQSQDYTPAIIENSRVLKMVSPAQVKSLGL